MRYAIAAGLTAATLSIFSADAETLNYSCRENGKATKIKIDDLKNTLTWMGKTYNISEEETCPRFGWRAEREGSSFKFCTATQGYADFEQNSKLIECKLHR